MAPSLSSLAVVFKFQAYISMSFYISSIFTSIFLLATTYGLLEKFPPCTVEFFQRSFLPHGCHYCWDILCPSCSVESLLYQREEITEPEIYYHITNFRESDGNSEIYRSKPYLCD
jgi:hypothetical protein